MTSAGAVATARPPRLADRAGRFAAGFRAVLERDFLVLTSAGRFVLFRTLLVALLAALTAVIVGNVDGREYVGGAVFMGFFVSYLIATVLVAPALAAGAIAGERSSDTLTLVLAAPVRPTALVAAKFLSRLGALLVPLVGGLPLAAVAFLYGGVSAGLYLDWLLVAAALAVMTTAASVLASAYARTVAGAVVGAYFLGVVVPGLESWLCLWLHHEVFDETTPALLAEHTLGYAVGQIGEAGAGRGVVTGDVVPFAATAALIAAAALLLAGRRLAREAAAAAAGGPRRSRARRVRLANPVLDHALAGVSPRRGGRAWWATFAVVGLLTWLPATTDWDDDTVIGGLCVATAATFVVVLARASQAVSAERQLGSLGVLLATPLRASQVVRGKLGGVAAFAALLLLPAAALAIAGLAGTRLSAAAPLGWAAASAALLFFFASLALWLSARASTGGRAAAMAFGTSLGGMAVHGLVVFVVALASHGSDVLLPLGMASPPALLGALCFVANEPSVSGEEAKVVAWAMFWATAYVGAGVALLHAARRTLERGLE